MKIVNLFRTAFWPRTEQPAEKKADPLPSSSGVPNGLKYEAGRGKGRFIKLFKDVSKNNLGFKKNQVAPGMARSQDKRNPVRNDSVPKMVVKTRDHDSGIGSKRASRPDTVGPESRFDFSKSDLVSAADIKKHYPELYTPKRKDPPSDPVNPKSEVVFSDSHIIPAAEIKKLGQYLRFKGKTDRPSDPVITNVLTDPPLEFTDGDVPPAKNKQPWQQHLKHDSAIGVDDDDVIPPELDLKPTRDVNPQNKVREPEYEPIELPTYSGYGGLNKAEVTCNDYAREAARMLIRDGKLDTRHIALMMVDASENQDLPKHYRAHLIRTYQLLESDGAIRAKIHSTCEHGWPTGKAAENLRTTLKLDPDKPVTDEHARMAQVMALLANYRQGRYVGDCFSFASASCLHADSPLAVTSHLKEMLEDNRLTLSDEGARSQVPFNGHFSRAAAQVPLLVRMDGKCLGRKVDGGTGDEYDLHSTPGMRAALQALGVPEAEMEFEVCAALWRMGVQDEKNHTVTCEQVIGQVASARHGAHDQGKLTKAALHAFCAQDSVGLLRAWEYTLAAKGTPYSAKRQTEIMVDDLVWDSSGEGRSRSLESAGNASLGRLQSQKRYADVPLGDIGNELFRDIGREMGRFCKLYGPDVENKTAGSSGVRDRGGWLLYDRTPPGDPKKWQRIDSEDAFRDAMAGVIQRACEKTSRKIGGYRRDGSSADPIANGKALNALTKDLADHVLTKEFIEFANSRIVQDRPAANGAKFQQAYGGVTVDLAKHLGSKVIHRRVLSPEDTSLDKAAKDQTDATEAVKFLCEGLGKMRPELEAKRVESPAGFRIPVANDVHGFTLLPQEFEGAWLHGATPERWIEKNLVEPATKHFEEKRLAPPLMFVLRELCGQGGMEAKDFTAVYQGVASRTGRATNLQQRYSLEVLHEALKEQYAGNPEMLAAAERTLAGRFPFPDPKRIADTNYPFSEDGSPIYLGVQFNPFKGRTELHFINEDGASRGMKDGEWLTGEWKLCTPLPARVA